MMQGSVEVLQSCVDQVIQHVGAKASVLRVQPVLRCLYSHRPECAVLRDGGHILILQVAFYDLEKGLFQGLWSPTPAASRVGAVLDELDEVMSQLFEFVEDQDIFQDILRSMFYCFVKVVACVSN